MITREMKINFHKSKISELFLKKKSLPVGDPEIIILDSLMDYSYKMINYLENI